MNVHGRPASTAEQPRGLGEGAFGHGAQAVESPSQPSVVATSERRFQGLAQARQRVHVHSEPPLTALQGLTAEAAGLVRDRNVHEADPGPVGGLDDLPARLRRIVVRPPVGRSVQVVELAHAREPRPEQLDVQLRGDGAHVVGRQVAQEVVHDLTPAPERGGRFGRARPGGLGKARQPPLEGVAVHVGDAGDRPARDLLHDSVR